MPPETEYLLDYYGACALERCVCNKPRHRWLGRGCPSWRPLGAKTWEELRWSISPRPAPPSTPSSPI